MLANITPVPNAVFDLYLSELKIAELKILLLITRQTLGWKDKKTKSKRRELDWISTKQLKNKTGCSKRTVVSAIGFLIEKNLITVSDEGGNILNTPDKRKGKQKLFYCLSAHIFPSVIQNPDSEEEQKEDGENERKTTEEAENTENTNAISAQDLRKEKEALRQKMALPTYS